MCIATCPPLDRRSDQRASLCGPCINAVVMRGVKYLTLRITMVLPLHINSGLGVITVNSFNL
jgi:hypothetical protein